MESNGRRLIFPAEQSKVCRICGLKLINKSMILRLGRTVARILLLSLPSRGRGDLVSDDSFLWTFMGMDANGFWGGYLARKKDLAKTAGQGDEDVDDDNSDFKQKVLKRAAEGMAIHGFRRRRLGKRCY